MKNTGKAIAVTAVLLLTAVYAGCSGTSGLSTGSNNSGTTTKLVPVMPPDAPPGITNESPMARPASVAWTSARAKRCGFFFDPVKLRATFLAAESRQPGQDLTKVEGVYDNTYKLILAKTSADAEYCNDKRASDIKAELARHLAGDFNPNLPKPAMVADCGMWGCAKEPKKITNSSEFFRDLDRKAGR